MDYKLSFPRHVKKAIDIFQKIKDKINLMIWIADARSPFITSKYLFSFLNKIYFQKNIIIFVNKMDCVDNFNKKDFENFIFQKIYECGKGGSSFHIEYGSIRNCKNLERLLKNLVKKELFLNCIVLGLPNVGKSSIINCLCRKKKAEVADIPGSTRNLKWISLEYNIKILDSPGIVLPEKIEENELIELLRLSILNYSFVNVPKEKIKNIQEY